MLKIKSKCLKQYKLQRKNIKIS